jgi:fatty acid/phospholipid biosynthesis enzyme
MCSEISEGVAESIISRLTGGLDKMRAFHDEGFIREFKENLDYAKYGGAPVLGINGYASCVTGTHLIRQ